MAVEKINLEISNTPQYREWLGDELNQTRDHVRDCLKHLKAKRRNDELAWLTRHIQVTLFCAERYSPQDDRHAGNADERLKNLESQRKLISRFTKLAEKDQGFELRFFLDGCYTPNIIPDENQRTLIWKTGLSNYERSLKREIKLIRESQKRMLIHRGGLLYSQFNANGEKARIGEKELKSTLFHLTYIFRHFTAGKLDLGTTVKKMPRFGEPRYDLTAEIFYRKPTKLWNPHNATAIKCKDNVKKYVTRLEKQDVYIGHWPPSLSPPTQGTFHIR